MTDNGNGDLKGAPWWARFIVRTGSLGVLLLVLVGLFVLGRDAIAIWRDERDRTLSLLHEHLREVRALEKADQDVSAQLVRAIDRLADTIARKE